MEGAHLQQLLLEVQARQLERRALAAAAAAGRHLIGWIALPAYLLTLLQPPRHACSSVCLRCRSARWRCRRLTGRLATTTPGLESVKNQIARLSSCTINGSGGQLQLQAKDQQRVREGSSEGSPEG